MTLNLTSSTNVKVIRQTDRLPICSLVKKLGQFASIAKLVPVFWTDYIESYPYSGLYVILLKFLFKK